MSCDLTQGFGVAACKDGSGGVIEFEISEFGSILDYTVTDGVITAITMAAGKQFWKYSQLKETSDWDETTEVSSTGGTIGYTQTANLMLFKRDTQKRNEIRLLAQNRLAIIVKDKSSIYWILGITQGCDMAKGTKYTSGKKIADDNAWSLVFTGAEHDPAFEVSADLIPALLAPAS